MPEKLLTIREVASYLRLSEEEVKRLVDIGEIPAYKIGGTFLRFRKEQIEAIKSEISMIEKNEREHAKPVYIKYEEPMSRQYDYTPIERLKDFLYFNDFYILSFIAILFLTYIIFKK